jgi:hypothetical protein
MKYRALVAGFLLFIAQFSFLSTAKAWGNRGHATVCEAAIFLMQQKNLRSYLQLRPNMIGYVCNVPDVYWKGLGPAVSRVGNPTHYINAEVLGLPLSKVPLDYHSIVTEFTGKKNAFKEGTLSSIPTELGSNWWRADQFYRRAVDAGKKMKAAPIPLVLNPEKNDDTDFNKAAYDMMVNLALIGHFVGDNGQPMHVTADHDGYYAGHGGLHSYFEDAIVAAQDGQLLSKVIRRGEKFQAEASHVDFLKEKTVLEKMRALAVVSVKDLPKLYKLDPVLEKSVMAKDKVDRHSAKRKPAEEVYKKFEPLLVTELARSATLLAQLWDQAYVEAGSPDFASYRSYKYPFTPEFVTPDYYDPALVEKK